MAMVGVDSDSLYRRTHNLSRLAWSEGRRPLGAILHSAYESAYDYVFHLTFVMHVNLVNVSD